MNHLFNNCNMEFKITYLSTLAYFISCEHELADDEKQKYFKIVDELGCGETKEDLYEFIKKPYLQELKEVLELSATEIGEMQYAEVLIEDIEHIYKDHKKIFFCHKKIVEWVNKRAISEMNTLKNDAQQLINELNSIK